MSIKEIIDLYYPEGTPLRDIYLRHSRAVAEFALALNRECELNLPSDEVENAAMLHDIGIFLTRAPGIHCNGGEPYIAHGYLGADLLRKHGFDERYARVCERHTGVGIMPNEIREQQLPLPADRVYVPETMLEKLVCYADKFYSKSGSMQMKSRKEVVTSIERFGKENAVRFSKLEKALGVKFDKIS